MNRRDSIKLLTLAGLGGLVPIELKALNKVETLKSSMFGDKFLWGLATAAYQIEGAWNIDGKGESIWDTFTHNTNNVKDKSNGNTACNFYTLYKKDIDLIKSLGFNVFRFSISWSRIMPNGIGTINQQGIDFYHNVIDYCIEKDIIPFVTLYHWDLPQALEDKGGWTNREIINWFNEYVTLCCNEYGNKVKNWIVLNEPMGFTSLGYMTGYHAPGKKGLGNFLSAVHHAVMCQAEGGRIIRSIVKDANIGTAFSCAPVEPKKETTAHQKAAKRIDVLLNRLFIEPSLGKGYPWDDLPMLKRLEKYMEPGDEQRMMFDFDFIGLQNYFRVIGKKSIYPPLVWANEVKPEKRDVPLTAMKWEIYPEGIYKVLRRFASYPIKKIIITENGAAFEDTIDNNSIHDVNRIEYYNNYLSQVLKAKQEGIPVEGYFAWTYMDNFEWAEGYTARFGIVHNDPLTQKRIIKDSGYWFQQLLNN